MITIRVFLIFFPFQFHAANHQRLSRTLVALILGLPLLECLVKLFTSGHPCDYAVDVVTQSLYEKSLSLEMEPFQFPLVLIQLVSLLLFSVTFLFEWRRTKKQQRQVAPMAVGPFMARVVEAPRAAPGSKDPPVYAWQDPSPDLDAVRTSHHRSNGEIILGLKRLESRLTGRPPGPPIGLLAIAVPPPATGQSASSSAAPSPLASLVARIGGLTVLVLVLDMMVIAFVLRLNRDSQAIIFALKAHCMTAQLVWYWISSWPEIREATDAKLAQMGQAVIRLLPAAACCRRRNNIVLPTDDADPAAPPVPAPNQTDSHPVILH